MRSKLSAIAWNHNPEIYLLVPSLLESFGNSWDNRPTTMAAKKSTTTSTEPCRIYAYHGIDDAQKRAALERLKAEIVDPAAQDFDLQLLYGSDTTADQIILAASVVPFMSKRRMVIVSQANDMPTAEQQLLAEKLHLIPDSACVVLVSPSPRMSDGKPKRGSEIHADLMKAVKKAGKAVDFSQMKSDAAVPYVVDLFKQLGKSIKPTVAMSMVRSCGTDSGVLASEAEKLVCFVGDRTVITEADIQQVTIQTPEEKIFTMMDTVGLKKPNEAIQHLRPLLLQGSSSEIQGEALKTLSMLSKHFRQLWQIRLALDAGCRQIAPGKIPPDIEAKMPNNENVLKIEAWKREKLVKQAQNFSLEELGRCFERLSAADAAIKGLEGSVSDPVIVLELLVIELASRPQSKRGRQP
ncbi:MAG TPA: DNA polymerase III subunit delta [Armatimonadota bacterium]|nr:DNA polymerase III subunit delta [Armatimonadota bacterium]